MIKNQTNPYFIKELSTGYVVLTDTQYFLWYILFLAKEHTTKLHFMTPDVKEKLLKEMSWVSEACSIAFGADKINLEMLGNGDSHAHWHILPRHNGDTPKPGPIWWVDPAIVYADETAPSDEELKTIKKKLNIAIDNVIYKYTH